MQFTVYSLIAGLVIGAGGGYKVRDLIADSQYVAQLEAERLMLIEAERKNSLLRDQLQSTQSETKTIYRTIVKRIPQDVTEIQRKDSDCNLTSNTERMLQSIINDTISSPK